MTLTAAPSAAQVGPPPPFDPELAPALRIINELIPPLNPDTLRVLRGGIPGLESISNQVLAHDGAFVVEERTVPGPAGAPDIKLLILRPPAASGSTPAIYHTHGGGMVMGDNRTGIEDHLTLAQSIGAAVVSVEYRLAPDAPHPAPVEDCYAGLVWTAQHADELNIDPDRIVIAGASAGGGLAAAVALLARDRGGPALFGQMLLCPMLDDRNDTPSAFQMAGLGVWSQADNAFGWEALLGADCGTDRVSPYAAPARATDLSGLPPAFIDVGSAETFRDEDVAYASRIWQAGGRAELHVWPGGFHGFDMMAPDAAVSQDARSARHVWLRRLFAV